MVSSASPATFTSSARRNRPYSFNLKPSPMARSRSAMLCAFEPVKYCMAAPRLSAATSRRSACKPPSSSTLDFVSPCPSTRATRGYSMKSSINDGGPPEASRSISPQVSQPRRRLPTASMVTPGARPCRYSASAAAASCASGKRWRPANRFRSSSALRISASFFAPIPFSDRIRPS